MARWQIYAKALRELGLVNLGWYAWYLVQLKSGLLRWRTKPKRTPFEPVPAPSGSLFWPPEASVYKKIAGPGLESHVLQEAEEILAGKIRLFGGVPVSLSLTCQGPLWHWTRYSENSEGDIKFIWEPGRFGWACTLARAYAFSRDERYCQAFWRLTDTFLEANPPFLGPHWVSAQEAAMRLIALVFAWQVFAHSELSTPDRAQRLSRALIDHARRIPQTLFYARAQNNNHLLVEAAGLYTAAIILPDYPEAKRWKRLGWHWLHWALQNQIDPDGTYIQQSTSYHRLMLQTALWCHLLASKDRPFPEATRLRLSAATRWLHSLVDPESGYAPNLGPNDGAYLLPLSSLPFRDFRPVLQAAMRAFTGYFPLENGPWDEMGLWLVPGYWPQAGSEDKMKQAAHTAIQAIERPHVLRSRINRSWAYLRIARFSSRPGHADQLHLDLWWQGVNIAQDAGTYLYNSPPPWDNALTHTAIHNTLLVNGQEQMQRISRFLYLDWAQGEVLSQEYDGDGSLLKITAQHSGYRHIGILHRRTVEALQGNWRVVDQILPVTVLASSQDTAARVHWLLPDAKWEVKSRETGAVIHLVLPSGEINLNFNYGNDLDSMQTDGLISVSLYRAGESVYGSVPAHPTWGWISPTYGVKVPALSLALQVQKRPPFTLVTEWAFTGK